MNNTIDHLNSSGNKLILGCAGSGKSVFLEKNYSKIIGKKVIISNDNSIVINNKTLNISIFNYSDINFFYYLDEKSVRKHLIQILNKSEHLASIFSYIFERTKKETDTKINELFIEHFKRIRDSLDFGLSIKQEIDCILNIVFPDGSDKFDLHDILSLNSDVLIIAPFKSNFYLDINAFKSYDSKINLILEEINNNTIYDNEMYLPPNIKLFMVSQYVDFASLKQSNYYSTIFLFKYDSKINLDDFLQTKRNYTQRDFSNLAAGDYFVFDINNKTLDRKQVHPSKEEFESYNYKYFFYNFINYLSNYGGVKKIYDIFIIENKDYKLVFKVHAVYDRITIINSYSKINKKAYYYNINLTTEQMYVFIENSYFFMDSKLVNLLYY